MKLYSTISTLLQGAQLFMEETKAYRKIISILNQLRKNMEALQVFVRYFFSYYTKN